MKLRTEDRLLARDVISGILYRLRRGDSDRSFGQFGNTVAMRHPYLRVRLKTIEKRVLGINELQVLASVFTRTGTLYLTTVHITHQLRTVAYTKYRQPPADVTQIHMKRIVLIDAQRRTAQNDTDYIFVVLGVFVIRQDLAERVQFAYAPTDQLRRLAAEIQDNNLLHSLGLIAVNN